MADDVLLNAGSGGETVATDQAAGGEHYQVVKLADGTADSTTHIPLSGDLSNGLDVDVTRVQGTVTVDGSAVTQPVSGTITLGSNSGVDIGDVDVTSIVPGTGATNLGKAEDAAHTTGDTGVMALGVRNDNLAALAGTDGDYAPLQVNAEGALFPSHDRQRKNRKTAFRSGRQSN